MYASLNVDPSAVNSICTTSRPPLPVTEQDEDAVRRPAHDGGTGNSVRGKRPLERGAEAGITRGHRFN